MEAWQQRVVDERDALVEKCSALFAFRASPQFYELERFDQDMLHSQAYHMSLYLQDLDIRIERFNAA